MPENNLPQPPQGQSLQQQPQYVYIQQPRYYNNMQEEFEIDLVELFKAVWKKKWLIFFSTFLFSVAGLAYALHLPLIYKAEARIMPAGGKSGGGGRLAGLMSQYGGIASMMGISMPSGSGGDGAIIVDLLQGSSVIDIIIDQFNLMEQYQKEYHVFARQTVRENLGVDMDPKGSGIITVSYLDEDPQKAADIVNAFIEELRKKLTGMSLANAKEKRAFYETQLMEVQQELTDAEEAMMKYQQSSGLIAIEEQAKALIDAIKALRSQIAAKNIEISSMRSYARSDNPMLKLAQSQLSAMQRELAKLEEEQRRSDSGRNRASSGDIMLSAGEIPELGVEYQRYMRALKIAGAKYELMFSQYESARLDEISDLSTITIVDPAVPPDYKDRPSRARITILWCMVGFMLPAGWTSVKYVFTESQKQKRRNKGEDDDDEDEY